MQVKPIRSVTRGYLLAVIASATIAGGCGGGGGSGGGTTTPTPVANISLSRSAIDFGPQVVGTSADRNLRISNTGTAELRTTLTSPGTGFVVPPGCATIAAGQSCDLTVQFAPSLEGQFNSSFAINSNAANTSSSNVTLAGKGNGLSVEISSVEGTCVNPTTITTRVSVSDAMNNPITYLTETAFAPSLNGTPVTSFTFVGIQDLEPVSIALALDWSRSLVSSRDAITQQSKDFIDLLQNTDSAGIYKFAAAIDGNAQDFLQTDAPGKTALKAALDSAFSGAETPTRLWDAVSFAIDEVTLETNPKLAVVLLTDGFDDGSTISLAGLIDKANTNNVPVFAVGFGTVNEEPLDDLARGTGGLYFFAPTTNDLAQIYEQIASIVTNQYELTFANPSPTTAQTLTVDVTDPAGPTGVDDRAVAACP